MGKINDLIIEGNCVRVRKKGIAYQFTTDPHPKVVKIISHGDSYGTIQYKKDNGEKKAVWLHIIGETITMLSRINIMRERNG